MLNGKAAIVLLTVGLVKLVWFFFYCNDSVSFESVF